MKYSLRSLMTWTAPILAMAISALVVLGALTPAAPWLRRIHSVQSEGGAIVIEQSPDGRLANPYRTYTKVSLALAAGIVAVVLLAVIAMVATLTWILVSCLGKNTP